MIRFEDLFIEDDLQLGSEVARYGIVLSNFEIDRIGIAAQSVGIAHAALALAAASTKNYGVLGNPSTGIKPWVFVSPHWQLD